MNAPTAAGRPRPALTIDVWSDTVCPWCWLGKRRLEAALRARPDLEVVVRWHPFELNPDLPAAGADRREYLQQKFGDPDRFRDAQQRLVELGRDAGIEYRFGAQARMPNTRASHALVHLAGEREAEVVEALFAAYFNAGRDVGDLDVLAAVAADAGLDGERVRERLAAREGFDAVESAEQQAYRMGISGVPFFVLAGRWAVSGAQETEAFVRALDAVGAELAKGGEEPARGRGAPA
jgi:predicted DsbA family dithiol-disulfide isomerase